MNGGELRKYAEELVTPKTRWLVIVTGCVSGVAGSLPFGPLFSVVPAILVLGAVLQRWSPRFGRWLMWLGAFFLTVDVGAFLGPVVLSVLRPPRFLDSNILIILSLCIVAVVLVCWCDVALVIGSRRSKTASAPVNQEFPLPADWIIGVIAICLTAFPIWSSPSTFYAIRHSGRWDILLFALPFLISVAAFDTAIVAHAVTMYRARRFKEERTNATQSAGNRNSTPD